MAISSLLVDGIQVEKVTTTSQSKSSNVWIYNTICTGYTWSPLTWASVSSSGVSAVMLTFEKPCSSDCELVDGKE